MRRIAAGMFVLAVALPAAGAEVVRFVRPGLEGPVRFEADVLRVDRAGGTVDARGGVAVRWGGAVLTADRVAYRSETGEVEASGNVDLSDEEGNRVRGSRMRLDLDAQTGELGEGELWIAREGYRAWGRSIRKTGPGSFVLEDGGFTACPDEPLSWRVEAERVEVELEGYLAGRGASFWVDGVPVLYTPYIAFPVITERKSGFLMPRVGYTSRQGFRVENRYYWAAADNYDLTFGLQYRSRLGWAETGEIRYAITDQRSGRFRAEHLWDRSTQANRYRLEGEHRARYENGARLEASLDYTGDSGYQRDLGDAIGDRGQERLRSYVLAARDAVWGTPYGLADYNQNLRDEQSHTLQVLPELGVEGRAFPLAGPLALEPTVRATRFWRASGERGSRLAAAPVLSAETEAGGIGLSGRAGYRQNIYETAEQGSVTRGAAVAEAGADATLWRPFGSWLHTVEPGVRFLWEEDGRGGAPPVFDRWDVFGARRQALWLLESRVLTAADLAPLAGLDLEGGYDLMADRWLPYRAEGFWSPSPRFSIRGDGAWDPRLRDPWLRWAGRTEGRSARGDRAFLGIRYVKNDVTYLDGGTELRLGRFFTAEYRHRYSLRDSRTVEAIYGLTARHPCWALRALYAENFRNEDDRYERRVYVELQLKGLGNLGSWKRVLP